MHVRILTLTKLVSVKKKLNYFTKKLSTLNDYIPV